MTTRSSLKYGRFLPLVHLAACVTLLGWPIALAQARTWTGNGGGLTAKLWSDPDNWSPAGVPQNGEDLYFEETAVIFSPTPMINDLTNLTVRSLWFAINADFLTLDWRLSGNELGITDSIRLLGTTDERVFISCPLRLELGIRLEVTDFDSPCELHLSGPMNLNGHALVVAVDRDNRVDLSGPIAGVGDIHIRPTEFAGNGPVTLSGTEANTFEGRIILYTERTFAGPYNGGRLVLNKSAGVAVPGPLILGREAQVTLQRPGQIADTAPVTIVSGGEFLLQGHNETIGGLVLTNAATEADPAIVRTGGGTLAVQGNIVTHSHNPQIIHVVEGRLELTAGDHALEINSAGYAGLDIQAELTGFGNFTKTGGAALILSASNSFNSSITIAEGVLDVRHNHALGDIAGSTAIGAGALTLRDVAIGEELLFALGQGTGGDAPGAVLNVVGVASWAGQVALYTNLNVIGGDLAFNGPISGEGGLGCFSGGTILLGGTLPNTYTGRTLSRSPLLVLAKSGGVRALAGPLEVGTASGPQHEVRWLGPAQALNASVTLHETAWINLNGFNDTFGPITFHGGTIDTGTGLLGINGLVTVNPSPETAGIGGHLYLNGGYREFRVFDGDPFDDLRVVADISGPGHLQKTGLGQLFLGWASSYTGLTLADEGVIAVWDPAALGAGDAGTFVAPGATLQLDFLNGATIGERISLLGSPFDGGELDVFGNATLRNQFPSIYACLDVGSNAVIYVGTGAVLIADGFIAGTGPWYKYGAGTLVFSNANANTYTGDTVIRAGTLELRKPNGVLAVAGDLTIGPGALSWPATVRYYQSGGLNPSSTVTVHAHSLLDLNGYNQSVGRLNLNDGGDVQTGAGTLSFPAGGPVVVGSLELLGSQASSSISGRIGLPPNSSLFFNVAPYAPGTIGVTDPELVVSALIPAPVENVNFERAGLYKNGAGEMRLDGNNTFNGRVEVAEGTVTVGTSTALGTTFDATYVSGSASLALITGFTIAGETLRLDSTHPTALHIRGGNHTWTGPIILARPSGIGVNQDWWLTASGVISGASSLTKWGAGVLSLSGSANNTYTGTTYVNEGTLLLAKSSGLQAVSADLVVGQTNGSTTAVARHYNHDQIWANTTVNHGGILDLNGFDEFTGVLTLNGGGDVQTGTGTIYPFTRVAVNPGHFGDPSVISGRLGLYQGTIPFTVDAGVSGTGNADCLISATLLEYSANTGLQKNGAGVLRLTGTNTYTGSTSLTGGTLWVDGLQAQSTVLADAGTTLKGSGTVGAIYLVGLGVNLMPGSSPGLLRCGGLSQIAPAGGILHMELSGTNPGTGYDQLEVGGPVNLNGLTLSASLGFASAVSNQFTLIANDSADAVIGTFTGLPEGKKFYLGQELFQITYTGATGNDVVLTRLVTPPPPVLTIEHAGTNAICLRWPTNDPPFSLQTATYLPATNWLAATPLPTVVGTNNHVTNTVAGEPRFYRLVHSYP